MGGCGADRHRASSARWAPWAPSALGNGARRWEPPCPSEHRRRVGQRVIRDGDHRVDGHHSEQKAERDKATEEQPEGEAAEAVEACKGTGREHDAVCS